MLDNKRDQHTYQARWTASAGTPDEDLLHPDQRNQASFFYSHYCDLTLYLLNKHFPRGISSDIKVLEIGCGRATASIYIALNTNAQIFPTDYSPAAVTIANKNLLKYGLSCNARQADLFELDDSNVYDVVISYGVMEHMPSPVSAYRAMYSKLKSGGIMISMNVPEKHWSIQTLFRPLNSSLAYFIRLFSLPDHRPWLDPKTRDKTGSVFRTYSDSSSFKAYAEEAGFTKVAILEVNPFPTIDPLPSTLENLVVLLYKFICFFRKRILHIYPPFLTSRLFSRCHFIVGEVR